MAKREAKRIHRNLTDAERERVSTVRQAIETERGDIVRRGQKYKQASRTARTIVNALKEARVQQGISLAGIKERTGMSREMICALENSENPNPTILTLTKFADAVGMTIVVKPLK